MFFYLGGEMKQFMVEYYGRVIAVEYIEAENEKEAWAIAEQTAPDYIDQANISWEVTGVEEEK